MVWLSISSMLKSSKHCTFADKALKIRHNFNDCLYLCTLRVSLMIMPISPEPDHDVVLLNILPYSASALNLRYRCRPVGYRILMFARYARDIPLKDYSAGVTFTIRLFYWHIFRPSKRAPLCQAAPQPQPVVPFQQIEKHILTGELL